MKAILAMLLFAVSAVAADVRVSWDTNKEENVSSYKVYWGSESGNYSNIITISDRTNTTAIVSNLPIGITLYLAVTAIDSDGQESVYSDEVIFTNGVTSRFIILLDKGATFVQITAVTELLKLKGWELNSRMDGVWLLSGVPNAITSRILAEDIANNVLVATKVKMVIKIPNEGPITYWGNAPKEVWVWMAKFWGKAG